MVSKASKVSKDTRPRITLRLPAINHTNRLLIVHRLLRDSTVNNPTISLHTVKNRPIIKDRLPSSTGNSHHSTTRTVSIARNPDRPTHPLHRINTANNPLPVASAIRLGRHRHLGTVNRDNNTLLLLHLAVSMVKLLHQVLMDSSPVNNIRVGRDTRDKVIMGSNSISMGSRVEDMVDSRVDRRSRAGKPVSMRNYGHHEEFDDRDAGSSTIFFFHADAKHIGTDCMRTGISFFLIAVISSSAFLLLLSCFLFHSFDVTIR
jgi:hypothetical protein